MNTPLSEIIERASAASSAAFSRSAHTLFRSSVHSSYASLSSLLAGRIATSERISSRISSSLPTPSTIPDSSLWNFALAVSHLSAVLPGMVFGEFTNNFPFSAINVKSESAAAAASPPPQLPNTAVICGITPEAIACL